MDVVYNHTPEDNELRSPLSFKGIDNASYYRLMPADAPARRSACRTCNRARRAKLPTLSVVGMSGHQGICREASARRATAI